MLSRFLPKSSHLRLLPYLYSKSSPIPLPPPPPPPSSSNFILRPFSTNRGDGDGEKSASDFWKLSGEADDKFDSFFTPDPKDGLAGISDSPATNEGSWLEEEAGDYGSRIFEGGEKGYEPRASGLAGISDSPWTNERSWLEEEAGDDGSHIFEGGEKGYEPRASGLGDNGWIKSEEEQMWKLDEAEEDKSSDVFDVGDNAGGFSEAWSEINGSKTSEEQKMLEHEEQALTAVLKGTNRAFGDLIAASGITDAMLDSLIALKNFEGVDGLPPLSEIEDMRYEKNTRKSARAEMERQKQEEAAKARVRQVDEKGRAYGTGRRKCSVARVWIQPGEGKFKVNDKEFDVYFPMLDHRAALLRPFSETKTLGLWDIDCTVKGGGLSGQVGAIQLGISRALQNWEPDLRPPLRNCGFLTRDARAVERKKPGKAKARKSFQWVKR